MTTADGAVIGTTQILNNGPRAIRWNVVLLGDGYRAADQPQFAVDAQAFVNVLLATPPFDVLQPAINVFRIDVTSTDTGADDPAACGGAGTVAATFFDATFCGDGTNRRLLLVNNTTVLDVVDVQVPEANVILVLVNSAVYGGSGGAVGTMSLAPQANQIGIHELGHTAFGLADEYEYLRGCGVDTDHNNHPEVEPAEDNITIESDRATIKWRNLIAPGTPVPTTSNANCTVCDPQQSPVPAGTVGAFEGAHYYHCGAFRPEFNCYMRSLGQPFCAVCTSRIRRTIIADALSWFHMSPIPGHDADADIDCSSADFAAKFAVAGDFDGNGQRDQLAICIDRPGTAGNDFWAMRFDDQAADTWLHMSPIPGHDADADIDCSGLSILAKFAVTGDFDGDGRDEIGIALDRDDSAGNDFWVMKFDRATGTWFHMNPIPGHPVEADFDCSGLGIPAKFAVTGDFDGDGRDEIGIALDRDDSAGNDFWVMKFDRATGTWFHMNPIPGHPVEADFDCSGAQVAAKFAVAGDFDGNGQRDQLAICIDRPGTAGNDFWAMRFDLTPVPVV